MTEDSISQVAAEYGSEDAIESKMANNLYRRAVALLLRATLVGLAILHTVALHAQEADIKEQLQGVDLTGVGSLTVSPNGKLEAGLTVLYGNSNPGSLVKIWAIKEKELLHQFRVPGKAHAIAFTPDSSTVVAADGAGNLASVSTIRAWDLSEGKERKVGTCVGEIGDFCFSPDGNQLAAVAKLGYFDNMAALKETEIACAGQIKVWRVNGEGNAVSINITHPLGEWVELWPPIEAWRGKRMEVAFKRVVPTRLRFSSDGKQLISETDAESRTIYDSQTGKILRHSNMSSVGVFKSMLMIALHQVPTEVTTFILELTPTENPMRFGRGVDGWWRVRKDKKNGFKVDGKNFVSMVDGVEQKAEILTLLGLKDDTNLAELSSVEHPLGVIKITREKTGLEFRLKEMKDGTESGKTIQEGEVRWARSVTDK